MKIHQQGLDEQRRMRWIYEIRFKKGNMEKDINKIGVYKIVFPDNCFYIGSAWNKSGIKGRWEQHLKGCSSSPKYLQKKSRRIWWMEQF